MAESIADLQALAGDTEELVEPSSEAETDATSADDQVTPDVAAETAVETTTEAAPSVEDDVSARLSELEKANKGLLKSLMEQRSIRQEEQSAKVSLQSQLDQIKGMVSQARIGPQQAQPQAKKNIAIPFDEDGNAYLPEDELARLVEQQSASRIQNLEQQITALRNQTYVADQQTAKQQRMNQLLQQNEKFPDANKRLNQAWEFLKVGFDDHLALNVLPKPTDAETAISMALEAEALQNEFSKKFPGMDMETTMEAFMMGTDRHYRKGLQSAIAKAEAEATAKSQVKSAIGHPPSLAKTTGSDSDSSAPSLLDQVANMDWDDYAALDAQTLNKIDKILAAQG